MGDWIHEGLDLQTWGVFAPIFSQALSKTVFPNILGANIRGQKLNTNFFCSNFFGRCRDIPVKSQDIPPKKFDFPDFEGHTELFGPHPFTWKTPTPPEISGLKSLGLGSFVPETWGAHRSNAPFKAL